MDARQEQAQELRRQIEWTLARAVDPSDVLPMLHRLARLAHDGSDDNLFANLHLAELLVERDPWRAALFARRVLGHRPEDDRGWATLALCQTLLGHYKFAVSAYHHALTSAPKNPWYAHNLGHLLDVALGRAAEAIGWLKRAYQSAPDSGEVAASYAHALARVGRLSEARKVLTRAMKRGSSREHAALLRWLEQGAPADKDHPLPRPAPVHAMAARGLVPQMTRGEGECERETRSTNKRVDAKASRAFDTKASHAFDTKASHAFDAKASRALDAKASQAFDARASHAFDAKASPSVAKASHAFDAKASPSDEGGALAQRRAMRSTPAGELDAVLARGLSNLPLDAKQRARAKALARDATAYFSRTSGARGATGARVSTDAVAAAIAYAIVYVDHIPLTQAEVASCFRVGVASLRGRFGELRSHLDLLPGDARYATLRRR
jgi:tetratricopeptide (TPR) repeat protein